MELQGNFLEIRHLKGPREWKDNIKKNLWKQVVRVKGGYILYRIVSNGML
jgi:hypothetical protein